MLGASLRDHEHNTTSFLGEDGVLEEIFRRLNIDAGTFVEVGAMDGIFFSNTWSLAVRGWSGVAIEANEAAYRCLAQRYRNSRVRTVYQTLALSGPKGLVATLQGEGVNNIDYVNIDVDGIDWDLFEDVATLSPKVICIEAASETLAFHRADGRTKFRQCAERLMTRGYCPVWTNGANIISIRRDIAKSKDLGSDDVEEVVRILAPGYSAVLLFALRIRRRFWNFPTLQRLYFILRQFKIERFMRKHSLDPRKSSLAILPAQGVYAAARVIFQSARGASAQA